MALQFNPYPIERDNRPSTSDYVQQWVQQLNQLGDTYAQGQATRASLMRQAELDKILKAKEAREQMQFNINYGMPSNINNPSMMQDVPAGPMRSGGLIDQFASFQNRYRPQIPSFDNGQPPAPIMGRKQMEWETEQNYKKAQTKKILRDIEESGGLNGKEKAPTGYRWRNDGTLEAIPGGPADAKLDAAKQKENMLLTGQVEQANNIIKKVDQALSKVSGWTAGYGSKLSSIPMTGARNLASDIETIKANLGFQQLQDMRRSSPTGGALGAISERELTALQSTVASLDQGQSPEQLRARLGEIKKHYENWKKTVDAGSRSQDGNNDPLGLGL